VKFRDVWRTKFWKKISSANSTNFYFLKNPILLMSQYEKSEKKNPNKKKKENKT